MESELLELIEKMDDSDSSQIIPDKNVINHYYMKIKRFCKIYKVNGVSNSEQNLFLKCLTTYMQKVVYHMISIKPFMRLADKEQFETYLEPIKNVLIEDTKLSVLFVIKCISQICDMISEDFHWSKLELLKLYVNIIETIPHSNSTFEEVFKSPNPSLIYTLIDMMGPCGDYEFQAHIIEVIYRLYRYDSLKIYSKKMSFFPESKHLDNQFLTMNLDQFDEYVRKFLLEFNGKTANNKIQTILCTTIVLDNEVKCEKPKGMENLSGMFVDFNFGSKSITWYSHENKLKNHFMSELSEEDTWCLIRIFVTDILNVDVKGNQFEIKLKPEGSCLCNATDLQLCLSRYKTISFTLSHEETESIEEMLSKFQGIFPKYSIQTQTKYKSSIQKSNRGEFNGFKLSSKKRGVSKSTKTIPFSSSILNSPKSNSNIDDVSNGCEIIDISSISAQSQPCKVRISSKVSSVIQSKQVSSSNMYTPKISKPLTIKIISGNCPNIVKSSDVSRKSSSLSDDIKGMNELSGKVPEERNVDLQHKQQADYVCGDTNFRSEKVDDFSSVFHEFVGRNIDEKTANEEKKLKILSPEFSPKHVEVREDSSETPNIIVSNSTNVYSNKHCEKFFLKDLEVLLTIDKELEKRLEMIKLKNERNQKIETKTKEISTSSQKSQMEINSMDRSLEGLAEKIMSDHKDKTVESEEIRIASPILSYFENSVNIIRKPLNTSGIKEKTIDEVAKGNTVKTHEYSPFAKKFSNISSRQNSTLNVIVEESLNKEEEILLENTNEEIQTLSQATTVPAIPPCNKIVVTAEIHVPTIKVTSPESELNVNQKKQIIPELNVNKKKEKPEDVIDSIQIVEQSCEKKTVESVKSQEIRKKEMKTANRQIKDCEMIEKSFEKIEKDTTANSTNLKRRLYDPEDPYYLEELSISYGNTKEEKSNKNDVFKKPRLPALTPTKSQSITSSKKSKKSLDSKKIKTVRKKRNSYVLNYLRDNEKNDDSNLISNPNLFTEIMETSMASLSSKSKYSLQTFTEKFHKTRNKDFSWIRGKKENKVNVLSHVVIKPNLVENTDNQNNFNGNVIQVDVNHIVDVISTVLKLVPAETILSVLSKVLVKLDNDSTIQKGADIIPALLALLRSHHID